MSIVKEFYGIAGAVLSDQPRVESIRITAVELTPAGPRVRWTGGPTGARVVSTEGGTRWRGGVGPDLLLECLSRYLAVRWRERSSAVPPAWSNLLVERHPRVLTSGGPYVRAGWAALVATGAEWIEELGIPTGFETDDVKEKFGQLRWHHHADEPDDDVDDAIEAVETLSAHVCDVCGAHGLTRGTGWIATRCGAHVEDR